MATLAAMTAGALVLGTAMTGAVATAAAHGTPRIFAPPTVPAGCTGGLLQNPSVENGSPPTGYTFEPASPVPPGTPAAKQPKLYTTGGYQWDGSKYALISTPDGKVSTAYETAKFVPGGVYTLTDWTGTHTENLQNSKNQQFSGLRFYDSGGAQVLENKLAIKKDVGTGDGKVGRQDFPPSTAPATAASVKFFVSTNYNWAKFDCIYLQLAAYSVKKEVQNPETKAWGPSATLTAGDTAHYRITVTNEGTQPLTGITVKDPWCATQPAPFDLAAGKNQAVACDHPNVTMADDKHVNTATVSNVKYPDGTLGEKTATATIMVNPPPAIDKVGDFVWIDQNRNGLQDSGEPGVEGVKVTLKDGAGGTVATKTTDASGKYLFDQLKDGTYQVCFDVANLPASVAGYQVTKKDAGDDAKDSDAGADGCTATTTLGANKREDLTLDLGLTPPANRLGDFVWADTNKNGLQDDGEPGVAGVKVTLKSGDGATAGTTTTGADGKYLFDGLNDGTYSVCFDMATLPADYAGYTLTAKDKGDDAKDSDADPATGCTPTTTLGASKREDLTLDAGIISPPDKVGDFVWVDTNKNGLQDAGEPGVQGVKVTLQTGDGTLVTTTTTGADGKYLFDGLNDGTYKVCFDVAHLPDALAGYQVTTKDAGDDAKDSDAGADGCTPPTTVNKDKREDLTLDLGLTPPPNRLGDYVWADTNKNGLQDDGEPAVPGVPVTLKDGTGATVGTTTTGPDGKYLFDNLNDGTYTVCFDMAKLPADYAGYSLTAKDKGDDAKDSDADPATGCTPPTTLGGTKHEDLTLDAGIVSPPNKLGDFVWIDKNKDGLQDAGEVGVPGVKVTLKDGTGATVGTTTTGADGKYLFDNLNDGTYSVCFEVKALPEGVADYQVTKQNAGDDGKDSDADISTGCTPPTTLGKEKREDLTLDLGLVAPANRLGDYVWADTNKDGLQDSGEPAVQGVKVTLKDGAGATVGTTTTDAGGKYLFDNLNDGTYVVCFDVKALPEKYSDATLTKKDAGDDGKDSDADVATGCTAPTTLGSAEREDLTLDAGLVSPLNKLGDFVWVDKNKDGLQDKDEVGVPGVKATLKDGDGKTVATVTTGPEGRYSFDNLPDGSYQVCFDTKALPGDFADYQLTKANAASHNGTDSAADLSTGCTPVTKLGVGHREDLTLDAGIIAPVNRVGDYVWVDKNANGVQDPGEPGVPGVKVTLKDDKGTVVSTQSTVDGGKYLFTDLPDGSYQVCFEVGSLTGDLAGATLTKPNAAGHNGTDSAADPATKCTPVTKVGPGKREDLTLDAGLVAPAVKPVNKLGDYVWYDKNDNGLQDPGEEGVEGVEVTLKDGTGKKLSETKTVTGGKYLFGNLPDGSYQVCFDTEYAPEEYRDYGFTKANAAGHNGKDSAADPGTKCTAVTKLGPDKREDLTLDAGITGGHEPAQAAPRLASTGSPLDWLAGLGALLLLGGAGLLVLVRRRSRPIE